MLRLKEALDTHTLLQLKTLYFEFPANADQAYLAYAQSWNLVDYMYNTFGLNGVHALVQDMNSPQHNFTEDLQQALGIDAARLENQWRISLHQPLIQGLDTGTLASQPARQSIPTPSLTDSNAPLLLTLGILLTILPLCGLIALFTYQHRVGRRSSAGAIYRLPTEGHRSHAGAQFIASHTPPGTPAVSEPLYPTPPFNERRNQTIDEFLPPPFAPGQEYGYRPSIKHTPQE